MGLFFPPERDRVRSGWMMCSVLVITLPSSIAHTDHSGKITVAVIKMLAGFVCSGKTELTHLPQLCLLCLTHLCSNENCITSGIPLN